MKRRSAIAASVLTVVLGLAACGSAGRQWDTTHANEVQKGVHTQQDVRAWFGEPYTIEPVAGSPLGCVQRWTYTYASSVAGGTTVSDTLVVDFDPQGLVCDNAYLHQVQ